MSYYILYVWKSVVPRLIGPFKSIEERNEQVKKMYIQFGNEHSYFALQTTKGAQININSYEEDFFKNNSELIK